MRGRYGRRTGRGARQTQERRSGWRGPGQPLRRRRRDHRSARSSRPTPGGTHRPLPSLLHHYRLLAPRTAGRVPGWEVGAWTLVMTPTSHLGLSLTTVSALTKRACPRCPPVGWVTARQRAPQPRRCASRSLPPTGQVTEEQRPDGRVFLPRLSSRAHLLHVPVCAARTSFILRPFGTRGRRPFSKPPASCVPGPFLPRVPGEQPAVPGPVSCVAELE